MASNAPAAGGGRVNWETAKGCLAELSREAPEFLRQAVLIGGAACWFYRHLLAEANHPEFPPPHFNEAEEKHWLSKDLDFTNVFAEDARQMLPSKVRNDASGRVIIEVAGLPIGFAQVGVTFDPESVWNEAWLADFQWNGARVQCPVIDPIRLHIEKSALAARRGSEADRLHLRALTEFLRLETALQIEALSTSPTTAPRMDSSKFLKAIADKTPEITKDARLTIRIAAALQTASTLAPAERRLIERLTSSEG
jgi:hypothetical protein